MGRLHCVDQHVDGYALAVEQMLFENLLVAPHYCFYVGAEIFALAPFL